MPTPIESSKPSDQAGADQLCAAAGDQPEHVRARRADGEPNADLAAAQADQVGEHAVAADAGERERQRAEHHQQVGGELLLEGRRLGVF